MAESNVLLGEEEMLIMANRNKALSHSSPQISKKNPVKHFLQLFVDGIVVCRTFDSENSFEASHCNMEIKMRQGDAIIFDVKGKKYLGHVQRFITPGIFQLTEKSLFSISSDDSIEFYELSLEVSDDKADSPQSYASNSYIIIESESGQINWESMVPRLQIYRNGISGNESDANGKALDQTK